LVARLNEAARFHTAWPCDHDAAGSGGIVSSASGPAAFQRLTIRN